MFFKGKNQEYTNRVLTAKSEINALAFLFAVTYMVSYITRINYGAIIAEMERATGMSKSLLSLALTGSFVTYGVGQVVSGVMGDRISPKRLVKYGLIVTVVMNFLIPVCKSPYQMLFVWCINGFAQSFMWPPLVKLMTTLLSEEDYKTVTGKVSWGSSIGTIVVYLLSPLCITALGWKSVFVFSALCGIVMIVIWERFSYEIKITRSTAAAAAHRRGGLFTPLMLGAMVVIALQGMLRDGVTTWMPSYILETYHLSSAISILTGVILPIFSIVCIQITVYIYTKKLKNPMTCAGVFFGGGAVSALLLTAVTGHSAGASVAFSAALTGCMHGVNVMITCMIPPFFKKQGNVSTVSGLLNACTYIGSALSTYGIAVLSEKMGWGFTLAAWCAIAALGTAVCLLCIRPWRQKMMTEPSSEKEKKEKNRGIPCKI